MGSSLLTALILIADRGATPGSPYSLAVWRLFSAFGICFTNRMGCKIVIPTERISP